MEVDGLLFQAAWCDGVTRRAQRLHRLEIPCSGRFSFDTKSTAVRRSRIAFHEYADFCGILGASMPNLSCQNGSIGGTCRRLCGPQGHANQMTWVTSAAETDRGGATQLCHASCASIGPGQLLLIARWRGRARGVLIGRMPTYGATLGLIGFTSP